MTVGCEGAPVRSTLRAMRSSSDRRRIFVASPGPGFAPGVVPIARGRPGIATTTGANTRSLGTTRAKRPGPVAARIAEASAATGPRPKRSAEIDDRDDRASTGRPLVHRGDGD